MAWDAAAQRQQLVMPSHVHLINWKMLPGTSRTVKHWSAWCGRSMTEYCCRGPTPKLTGPETYNQVTRHLASKVFRGVQVRCLTRTSAQFDEPSPARVRSVVFAMPPSGAAKSSQAADAMDTSPRKEDQTLEGAVGGQIEEDPNTHPMAWMRDRQNSYSDEEIHFWPLLRPLTDGGGTNTRRLAWRLLSTWQWSAAIETAACPPAPSNMEIGHWLPLDRRGK